MNELEKAKEWKEIKEYPNYLISEDGKVFSKKRNKIMKTFSLRGYERVALNVKDKLYIHRIVCSVFNGGDLFSDLSVDHIDMKKTITIILT